MNSRQLQAKWFSKRTASPLTDAVKEGLKSGNFVGEPKIGDYTVAPEGVVVEATVSVIVPSSKILSEAPPKESLKLVFEAPALLTDVSDDMIKDIPFRALKEPQFSAFVKKMGGLGQYSDEVLIALLEGRSKDDSLDESPYEVIQIFFHRAMKDMNRYIDGPLEWENWGGDTDYLKIKVKGGVVGGIVAVPVKWSGGSRGLKIKRELPYYPYVDLDPAIHGEQVEYAKKSTHPSLAKVYQEEGGKLRVNPLPKGTPGVLEVVMLGEFRMEKTPLSSLDRDDLEKLVRFFAGQY